MPGVFRRVWRAAYRRRSVLPSAQGGVDLTVTAQQGLVHVTGQNATVNASRVVTAQQGLVHVTGQNATIGTGLAVTAQQGLVHVTGQNASVNASRVVTAQQGLVHVTGQNATVTNGLAVTAQQGLVHVTGQNATVNASRVVTAQQGLVHVTGQNASVTNGLAVTAQQGLVHVTGQNATVNASRVVTAQQGLVHVTGQNATVTDTALTYRTGDAMAFAQSELDVFFSDRTVADDVSVWMGLDMGFAESVFVGATEIAGVFTDHSAEGGQRDGPRVLLKSSDVDDLSIDQGTVLTIRSRTFHVRGDPRDGLGVSDVVLDEPA